MKKQEVKQSYEKRQMGKKERQQAHAENERLQAENNMLKFKLDVLLDMVLPSFPLFGSPPCVTRC